MLSSRLFTRFANGVARAAGKPYTFALCCLIIVAWSASGPYFKFSDTWQLVINTSTTIITFLMVFLIQNTQNRDGAAMQAKLDEIIRSLKEARNEFVGIEHLTEEELDGIREDIEAEVRALAHEDPRRHHAAHISRALRRLSDANRAL